MVEYLQLADAVTAPGRYRAQPGDVLINKSCTAVVKRLFKYDNETADLGNTCSTYTLNNETSGLGDTRYSRLR